MSIPFIFADQSPFILVVITFCRRFGYRLRRRRRRHLVGVAERHGAAADTDSERDQRSRLQQRQVRLEGLLHGIEGLGSDTYFKYKTNNIKIMAGHCKVDTGKYAFFQQTKNEWNKLSRTVLVLLV